jgi:hypothetical protein
MIWSIVAEPCAPPDGTNRPAMDVDPLHHVVRLGLRSLSGGGPEIASGAIARSFFSGDVSGWGTAESWLRGPEAQALLEAIGGGQTVDLIWSGDLVVQWSEAALAAGRELHAGVERTLEIRPGTASS